MSLRAIKKRDQLNSSSSTIVRPTLFRKLTQQRKSFPLINNNNHNPSTSPAASKQQRSTSNPELRRSSDEAFRSRDDTLVRTRSESDVSVLLDACHGNIAEATATGRTVALLGAKSEVCLQTISSHSYHQVLSPEVNHHGGGGEMFSGSGARSHRDLSQSAYGGVAVTNTDPLRRRMSECSSSIGVGGAYSQRTSAMSSSALTLTSSSSAAAACTAGITAAGNAVLRVPIIGYEVMEERARFTVYKLRVDNPHSGDCWLVLRRYTDFVRLNTKLKQSYPQLALLLPRKKIFGDNFNAVFLDNRVQGLQMFVNAVMAKEELRRCKMVREFFCLDEPPSYSESMEECRAIFEAQEETIAHLKLQINNKNDLILNLQQKLRDEMLEKEQLKETLKNFSLNGTSSLN